MRPIMDDEDGDYEPQPSIGTAVPAGGRLL